jgi:hypothetical protein
MNMPPLSPITLVTPGHADDGANGCELMAFLAFPAAFPNRVNDCAEPAQPPILHSSAGSLPSQPSRMGAKTAHNNSPCSASALQFP